MSPLLINHRPAQIILLALLCILSVTGNEPEIINPPCGPGYYACQGSWFSFYITQSTDCSSVQCFLCKPGTFQPDSDFSDSSCTNCAKDTFCGKSGCTSCEACGPDTFAPAGSSYCHTHSRTSAPSSVPTPIPSAAPTVEPSSKPTAKPTPVPSSTPTLVPLAEPTCKPTSHPSSVPTKKPLSHPTPQPSAKPSSIPSVPPTSQPSHSQEPSHPPVVNPSPIPTVAPTPLPSSPTYSTTDVTLVLGGISASTIENSPILTQALQTAMAKILMTTTNSIDIFQIGAYGTDVKIKALTTSKYDVMNTALDIEDARNQFLGIFLDTAQKNGYTDSLSGVTVVFVHTVSPPTPSPTANPRVYQID